MIVFVATRDHNFTIRKLLEDRRTPLHGRMILLDYEELLGWQSLPSGKYILADIERLPRAKRQAVAARLEQMRRAIPELTVLNDPMQSMDREQLLERLHHDGVNDFRAVRADGDLVSLRYPVFVRQIGSHNGSLTELLPDAAALRKALDTLGTAPGVDTSDLLVVEFIDVRNADGLYEKYSVFRIGNVFFASDFGVSRGWVCKQENAEFVDTDWVAREVEFLAANPHVDQVRGFFDLAHIDYGRIDYAFKDGRIQVFEINTNPMIETPASMRKEWRVSVEIFVQTVIAAFRAFVMPPQRSRPVAVPGATGSDEAYGPTPFRRQLRRFLRRFNRLELEPTILLWRQRLRWHR